MQSRTRFKGYWVINNLTSGCIYADINGRHWFENSNGKRSSTFDTEEDALNAYYIQEALDHLGSAIRDNSRETRIAIGKQIDEGTWDEDAAS